MINEHELIVHLWSHISQWSHWLQTRTEFLHKHPKNIWNSWFIQTLINLLCISVGYCWRMHGRNEISILKTLFKNRWCIRIMIIFLLKTNEIFMERVDTVLRVSKETKLPSGFRHSFSFLPSIHMPLLVPFGNKNGSILVPKAIKIMWVFSFFFFTLAAYLWHLALMVLDNIGRVCTFPSLFI